MPKVTVIEADKPAEQQIVIYIAIDSRQPDYLDVLQSELSELARFSCTKSHWRIKDVYIDYNPHIPILQRPSFNRILNCCKNHERVLFYTLREMSNDYEDAVETLKVIAQKGMTQTFCFEKCDYPKFQMMTLVQTKYYAFSTSVRAVYGYCKVNNGLRIDAPAAAAVRLIFSLYIAGESNASIALAMNSRQIPAPNGNKWNPSTIGKLLQDTRYIGYSDEQAGWDPIIEQEIFNAVQAERKKRAKRKC